MFKNPLKYQQGGSTTSAQQQEKLVQLFQMAAKNAQVDPQALVQKAQELGNDENAASQFMEGLQRCAQGDPAGIKFIQDLFKQPAYKQGGKIHDFVCKHANGGKAGCGCGESVKKAQGGETMPYTRGSYQPSDYFNNTGTWIETPNGVAQNYRPYFIGGRNWGFGGNDLEQVLVVPGVTGIPRRAVRRISNWFNPDIPTEKLDTTYQDANGNSKNSAEFEARVNRELEGVSGSRPTTKENGGKVEKARGGSVLDYYSNKWGNDLSRIKSGWNRFKESAPGRVLGFFMPNPNSESGMLGAAAPIGKIKYIPEGVSGTEKAAKWVAENTPNTPHIVSLPPRQVDETQGAKIVNGLREWLYGKRYNGR